MPGSNSRPNVSEGYEVPLSYRGDLRCTFSAYAFGREMVCSQKSVRNRNFFENAGHVSFSFCQTGSAETHTKPCKTSPQGTSIKRPAIYWDHAVSWGWGGWVSERYWSGWQKNGVAPHSYIFPVNHFLKKNQNAPRPSEHPPVRGKKCQNV